MTTPFELILVRHGETVWNRERRSQGWGDSPLTPRGQEQVRAMATVIAPLLRGRQPKIVRSPLGRVQHSTEILLGSLTQALDGFMPVSLEVEPRIKEYSMGQWEGHTRDEVEAKHPGATAGGTAIDWYYKSAAFGGESVAGFIERIDGWFRDFRQQPGLHLVVAHGLVGKVMRGLYLGLDLPAMLAQIHPQDRVYHLADGRVVEHPCPEVPEDFDNRYVKDTAR